MNFTVNQTGFIAQTATATTAGAYSPVTSTQTATFTQPQFVYFTPAGVTPTSLTTP